MYPLVFFNIKGDEMFSKLLLLFIFVPFLDLAILIKLGEYIGFWQTIAIIIITGVTGAVLVKREGLSVIQKIKTDLGQSAIPGRQLVNGLLVLIGGILLMTPGILSDAVGFILVIPGSRGIVREKLISYFRKKVGMRSFKVKY